ncbi:hypothetical protein CVT24_001538 [Panaeolus cyanescens]|uniref:Uncharacterized protein n=1 Tax=Panaeolus cyanescens TaxID=181874 RepID=A0A409YZ01_9AGAR|nr:hypothetical protein CVT24_001538 [Panaeolus cyanescens]
MNKLPKIAINVPLTAFTPLSNIRNCLTYANLQAQKTIQQFAKSKEVPLTNLTLEELGKGITDAKLTYGVRTITAKNLADDPNYVQNNYQKWLASDNAVEIWKYTQSVEKGAGLDYGALFKTYVIDSNGHTVFNVITILCQVKKLNVTETSRVGIVTALTYVWSSSYRTKEDYAQMKAIYKTIQLFKDLQSTFTFTINNQSVLVSQTLFGGYHVITQNGIFLVSYKQLDDGLARIKWDNAEDGILRSDWQRDQEAVQILMKNPDKYLFDKTIDAIVASQGEHSSTSETNSKLR